MTNYNANFWSAEAVGRLAICPKFTGAAGAATALAAIRDLRKNVRGQHVQSANEFDAVVDRAVAEAERLENCDPRRIRDAIQRHFDQWRDRSDPPAATLGDICTRANSVGLDIANLEREATTELARFEARCGAPTTTANDAPLSKRWNPRAVAVAVLVGALGAVAVWIIGFPRWCAPLGFVVAAGGCYFDAIRKGTQTRDTTGRGQRFRPALQALAKYFKAATRIEAARHGERNANTARTFLNSIEADLEAQLAEAGKAALRQDRPGSICIGGESLAHALAGKAMRGAKDWPQSITTLPIDSAPEKTIARIRVAAAGIVGRIRVSDLIRELTETPGGRTRFETAVQHVRQQIESVVAVHQKMLIDRTMCPSITAIGIPEGEEWLAALVRTIAPNAPLFEAFRENSIEFVYDIQNLSADDLARHKQTAGPYSRASELDRKQLMPFPRRYRALISKAERSS